MRIIAAIFRGYLMMALGSLRSWIGALLGRKIPENEYWAWIIQAAFVICCISCFRLWPAFFGHSVPPGIAIAALGFGAVIMTVRADKFGPREKVVWVTIAFALLVAELVVIENERSAQEHQHSADISAQQDEFLRTLGGLKDAQNMMTGGDSYDVISPIPLSLSRNGASFVLEISIRGKYPMWDVVVEMEKGPIRYTAASFADYLTGKRGKSINLGAVSTTFMKPIGVVVQPSPNKTNIYLFRTWSRTLLTTEELDIRFNPTEKRWETAYKVRHEGPQILSELDFGSNNEIHPATKLPHR